MSLYISKFGRENRLIRSGFSLLEVLLGLIVAAVILSGIVLLAGNADTNRKSNELHEELSLVENALHYVTSSGLNMSWMTTQTLVSTNLVPDKYISADRTIFVTPWKTGLVMYGYSINGQDAADIYAAQIPRQACLTFSGDWNGAEYLFINGTQMSVSSSPTDYTNACAQESNTIELYYVN